MVPREAHSYRRDPSVPPFPDDRPELVARNRMRIFGRSNVCYRPDPLYADRALG